MGTLSELSHWLWIEMQLGTPPFIQRTIIPTLHKGKEFARMLVQPYLYLYELRGQSQAGPLTVTYGGLGYAKPMLKKMLFDQEPTEREIGRVSVLRPTTKLLDTASSDLTIIESSQYLIRMLSVHSGIKLPFRVQLVLDIQGDWQAVEERFRPNTRRHIRKAKQYDRFEYEISRHEQDLDMFYHRMYLPTVKKRHGALAAILPEREAYQILRHGWLFLVKRDDTYICGSLGHEQQGTVEFKEMGVLNGDMQLMQEGGVEAMNYLRIRWAHQEGFKELSFGDCWPYLSGIFLFKRKWGAAVSIPCHEHKQIWIRIQRDTPAVSQFLESNPCIIVDNKGELQALIVTDAPGNVTPGVILK